MKGSITSGFVWKLLERFGVQGVQFVMQIVLARLLDPEHYGELSMMVIFTTLATIFIQAGFNTSLIQNKDVTDDDYSSVLWLTLGLSGLLYGVLFFTAPLIAAFYEMPDLVAPFRALAFMLFPGAFNSIQLAKVSRELDFRNVFFSNIGAIVVSGVVGIVLAFFGAGLWALVIQNILNVVIASIIMWFTVKWRPKWVFRFDRIKVLFGFGWKLLVTNLLDTLYQDLRSLVIGKKYDSGTLGYYNRGKQFPQFIINAVNGTVQSVMLPAMSAQQDDKTKVKSLTRMSISLSTYIILPVMAGLAATSPVVVELLLTEKWMPCVPYLQIYCFSFAFYPVHSCNLQAINAMGRSDLSLVLEVIKKVIGIIALVIAVFCFDSPIAIAATGVFTTVISFFVNAYPNRKLIDYSYAEQLKDLGPSIVLSAVMCLGVYSLNLLPLPGWLLLIVQVVLGVLVYVGASYVLRLQAFEQVLSLVRSFLAKRKA